MRSSTGRSTPRRSRPTSARLTPVPSRGLVRSGSSSSFVAAVIARGVQSWLGRSGSVRRQPRGTSVGRRLCSVVRLLAAFLIALLLHDRAALLDRLLGRDRRAASSAELAAGTCRGRVQPAGATTGSGCSASASARCVLTVVLLMTAADAVPADHRPGHEPASTDRDGARHHASSRPRRSPTRSPRSCSAQPEVERVLERIHEGNARLFVVLKRRPRGARATISSGA